MNHGAVSLTISVGIISANRITCVYRYMDTKKIDCGI